MQNASHTPSLLNVWAWIFPLRVLQHGIILGAGELQETDFEKKRSKIKEADVQIYWLLVHREISENSPSRATEDIRILDNCFHSFTAQGLITPPFFMSASVINSAFFYLLFYQYCLQLIISILMTLISTIFHRTEQPIRGSVKVNYSPCVFLLQ